MRKCLWLSVAVLAGLAGAAHADGDVPAGKRLYVDNCLRCHGNKGQGGVGAKLRGDSAYWDLATFKKAVLTGIDDEGKQLKPVMPRWGKVGLDKPKGAIPTDRDLSNIQAYLKTFGPKEGD
jgi:mono/diheme cytochrome c family protein